MPRARRRTRRGRRGRWCKASPSRGRRRKTSPRSHTGSNTRSARRRNRAKFPPRPLLHRCSQRGPPHVSPPAARAQFRFRHLALARGPPRPPIEALHLIRRHCAARPAGEQDFERIALDPGSHRATRHQSGSAVVAGGTQHERGPVPHLFMAGLRIGFQPNGICPSTT
jgi:hypothetical protein